MLLLVGSAVLSIGNLAIMWGLKYWAKAGPCLLLVLQLPWSFYDVATHQYGFLILTVASVTMAIWMLTHKVKAVAE